VNPPLQTEDIEDIETDAPVSAAKNVHDDIKQNGKLASNSIEPDSIDQMAYENLELAPATTTNVDTSDNGLLSSLVSDNGYYEEVKFSNGLKNKKQRKNSSEAAFDGDGDGDGSSYEDVVVNDDLSGAAAARSRDTRTTTPITRTWRKGWAQPPGREGRSPRWDRSLKAVMAWPDGFLP
jgi:hypothetical protein